MLLVFSTLVAAAAAEYFSYTPPNIKIPSFDFNEEFLPGFSRQMEQFNRDMQHMQLELAKVTPTEEITQSQYILTYQLPGFQKQDIEVFVNQGMLMVQAIQKNGPRIKQQTNQRNLPDYVDPNGRWAYIGEILRIVFPLKSNNQRHNVSPFNGKNDGNAQGTGEARPANAGAAPANQLNY